MAYTISNSAGLSGEDLRQARTGLASGITTTFKALAHKLAERAKRAHDLQVLQSMDHRELKDMGISSSDIYRVVDGDFDKNR